MSCGCYNNRSRGCGCGGRSEESKEDCKLRRAFAEGFNRGVRAASQAALDLYKKSDKCFEDDEEWKTDKEVECHNEDEKDNRDEECGSQKRHRNSRCRRCCS